MQNEQRHKRKTEFERSVPETSQPRTELILWPMPQKVMHTGVLHTTNVRSREMCELAQHLSMVSWKQVHCAPNLKMMEAYDPEGDAHWCAPHDSCAIQRNVQTRATSL